MTEIQNQLKWLFDSLINQYSDKNSFGMSEISNSSKQNCIGYTITHRSASMLIRIEYFDNKIVFDFYQMSFNTRDELSTMTKLIEYIELIPQEELKSIFGVKDKQ